MVLCASVVKSCLRTFTTETPRSREITRRNALVLKIQNPATSLPRESDRLATGPFPERKKSLRPEHLFAGVQKLQQRPGRSPDFEHRFVIERFSSQWRDRAGFSPASLFFPLLRGTPERIEKNSEREVPAMCAHVNTERPPKSKNNRLDSV